METTWGGSRDRQQPLPSGSHAASAAVSIAMAGQCANWGAGSGDTGDENVERIPLVITSELPTAPEASLFAARFPKGLGPYQLPGPLNIKRDNPEIEDEEAESTNVQDVEDLPWRLVDVKRREFVGRRDGLDTSTYFLCIDRGDHCQLVGLDGWYTFTQEIGAGNVKRATLEERKRRAAPREIDPLRRVKILKENESDDDEGTPRKRPKASPGNDEEDDDELGLRRRELRQKKRLNKRKKEMAGETKDSQRMSNSALNIGAVTKAKVDWDFDGDVMSDDEDNLFGSDAENDDEDAADAHASDFEDSEDDEEKDLTTYGQRIGQLLEIQRENEADDELAQLSDDEEDAAVEGEQSVEPSAEAGGAAGSSFDASGLPAAPNAPLQNMAASVVNVHGTLLVPPSAGETASGGQAVDQQSRRLGGQPKSAPDSVSATSRGAASSSESIKAELAAGLKRAFHRHGGILTPKQMMKELKITGTGEKFVILKELLREMCRMGDDTSKGKILELKEQFRTA